MATFAYDSLNRLTHVAGSSYLYDAEDNRISVTDSVYQTTTGYVINPQTPLSQVLIKSDGQGQTFYVYGLGLIGEQDSDGTYKTYHYDYRGSTVALTDNNGSITDRFQYGPYGNVIRRLGETDTPFLYCGKYGVMHDSNGLYYMRARYYSPAIKMFLTRDSYEGEITNPLSLNLYGYCVGNPLKYLDPTGHDVAVDNYKPNYEDPAYYSFYRWWNGNPWDRFGMDPAYMYPEAFLNTLYMLEEKGINTKNLDTCQLDLLYDRVHRGEDMTRLQASKILMLLGAAYGRSAVGTGGAGNASKWLDESGNIIWPKNDGFLGKPQNVTLTPGTIVDRYGYESGKFVSPQGTLYEMRSLAPGTESKPYNAYEVIKPIEAQGGKIAPWFDQPGGGVQYKLNQSVEELIDKGYLRKVGF